MQEEVENRTVALAVSTTRMSGRVLKAALIKLLTEMKKSRDSPPLVPHGKQTVKELIGQNAGVSNIEITDKNLKSFEQVARKYGVDYALKKDITDQVDLNHICGTNEIKWQSGCNYNKVSILDKSKLLCNISCGVNHFIC